MRIAFFVHSVASCWNNGNAHFLRGVMAALQALGHEVAAFEPRDGWSRANLVADHGAGALAGYEAAFPGLRPVLYDPAAMDLEAMVDGADLAVVHEWNEPALVNRLGRLRAAGGRFRLLFHDTHHRAVTRPEEMGRFDLSGYDGVLAFGAAIGEIYRRRGWADRVWTWHEAADVRLFHPIEADACDGDLVWVGNWGDEERSEEIRTFLLEPAAALGLETNVYGVRYPEAAMAELAQRGVSYRGWLPNHAVPEVFARHRVTVHVPRRPYAEALAGIPTIRVFEALACGIPLVSAPWQDSEGLFPEGAFLMARNGAEMTGMLRAVLNDRALAESLRRTGLDAVLARHTCDHRARDLVAISAALASGHHEQRVPA
ncbi:CgeB family protein [Propylenella binzhouense]|uniref:Glycosyltransferase n=1 Tax=Propylenella binzhouense TaxID=2555902 RepID=A0A964WUP8_9HYPH|nr:glycosyltransferase [Propylenella binzhouense]MYZ49357.1 glycosyltransferase [Propylenella binzhouense]